MSSGCCARIQRRQRGGCTSSRCCTWRCCLARWWWIEWCLGSPPNARQHPSKVLRAYLDHSAILSRFRARCRWRRASCRPRTCFLNRFVKEVSRVEHLRHLLPFVKRYRWQLLFGLICAACSAALTATIPQLLRLAVDELHVHGVVAADLLRFGLIMIGLALLDSLFRFGHRLLVPGASYLVEFDIRSAMFRRLLLLDQGFYGQAHTGDLMTRVTNDLSAVRQFLGTGVNSLMNATLYIAFAGTLLFRTNAALALLVLALLPAITLLFVIVGGRMRKIFRGVQDQFGDLSTRAQENFSGIRTIKAYAQEEAEIRVFRAENERYRATNVRYVLLSGLLWPAIAVVMGLISAVVLLVGGRFVAEGRLSLGDLVLFNTYLTLLAWPMISLGWTVNLYQQASASMGRIAEVLHRRPDIATPEGAPDHIAIAGTIEFRDVGIRFEHALADEQRTTNDERESVVSSR